MKRTKHNCSSIFQLESESPHAGAGSDNVDRLNELLLVKQHVETYVEEETDKTLFTYLRLARGVASGNSTVKHACEVGHLFHSEVFKK